MALQLKTPGVYVEELSTLPPSIAQVATAVPAFIGYTAKAAKTDNTPLYNVPVRISSMLEYEKFFGTAEDEVFSITVTDNVISTNLATSPRSNFKMYYSLQMYFANGGGPCYIVSVGNYDSSVSRTQLAAGLAKIEKEDEPTLILFPDAISIPGNADQIALYEDALALCNKLQDRFTIMDVRMLDTDPGDINPTADMLAFRAISSDASHRRYGAAYYPYVNTVLDYQYNEEYVQVAITSETDYDQQVDTIGVSLESDKDALAVLLDQLDDLDADLATATDAQAKDVIRPQIVGAVSQIIATTETVIAKLENATGISRTVLAANPASADYATLFSATNILDAWTTGTLSQMIVDLNTKVNELAALSSSSTAGDVSDLLSGTDSIFTVLSMNTPPDIAVRIGNLPLASGTDNFVYDVKAALAPYSSASTVNKTLEELATYDNALYNRIKATVSQIPVLLPPSGSIAGVYARVDASEGVWKAPANVGLSYVLGPNYMLSNDEQNGMNVEDTYGKSVNAIRSFTGRGTLVWGARTLDGNSNEWRYVPVRRFFNMVEESVQQAAESFVFEANDANTWVKVRAMIENYLTLQWKAGALAGAKPEQAFYVRVGLGQTMTAEDILNGHMIVEIGMAVVRPAEFIVLRFSHMMQQA